MKTIPVILFVMANLIFSLPLFSQDSSTEENTSVDSTDAGFWVDEDRVDIFNNSAGIRYSTISGYGVSLSRRFAENYEIQLNFYMHYNQYTQWEDLSKTKVIQDNKDILYDFGVEFRRDVFKTDITKIYIFAGGYYSNEDNNKNESNVLNKQITGGLGFGLQFFASKYISGDFNLGYKIDKIDAEENEMPSQELRTYVGFSIGLVFHF